MGYGTVKKQFQQERPLLGGDISIITIVEPIMQFLHEQNIVPQRARQGKYKVVMRVQAIQPKHVKGIIARGQRKGDKTHIVPEKADLRAIMIGDDSVAKKIVERQRDLAEYNRKSSLSKRNYKTLKEMDEAIQNTPLQNPWKENLKSIGPLREGIISVHRDFFAADENTKPEDRVSYLNENGDLVTQDKQKHRDFYKATRQYLKETFGDDCIYARYDGDEQSGHVHFILSREVDLPPSVRYPQGRRVFQVNKHPLLGEALRDEHGGLIKPTERLQDSVGEFFETKFPQMNIKRGMRRAQAKREADRIGEAALKEAQDRGEKIPAGSQNAQALYVLKKRIAEEEEAKKMGRKDTRGRLAIEYLVALGALSEDVLHQHPKRREMDQILAGVEAIYGTREQIIEDPQKVADIYVQQAKAKAAEEAAAAMSAVSKREAAIVKREAEIARREKAAAKRESDLNGKNADLDAREIALEKRDADVSTMESRISGGRKMYNAAVQQIKDKQTALAENEHRLATMIASVEKTAAELGSMAEKKAAEDLAEAKWKSRFFLVPRDEKPAAVSKGMEGLTNNEVCTKTNHMKEFAEFLEGDMREDAARGFAYLAEECERRGIDYKNWKRIKPKDQKRADLHVDELTQYVSYGIDGMIIHDRTTRGAR